jgi:prepilin-type N-terminal cleavage/methylation domain-containing protein
MIRTASKLYGRIARDHGFTMVELIIVIAIAAILMTLSLPYYVDWRKNINYRETARSIVSMLREARSNAIAKGLQHQVVVNPTNKSYQLQSYNIASSSFNSTSQIVNAPTDVTIKSSITGTTIADMTTTNMNIIFNSNGTATIGAAIGYVFINDATGTQKYIVTVMQTGRISSFKK